MYDVTHRDDLLLQINKVLFNLQNHYVINKNVCIQLFLRDLVCDDARHVFNESINKSLLGQRITVTYDAVMSLGLVGATSRLYLWLLVIGAIGGRDCRAAHRGYTSAWCQWNKG